MTHKLVKEGDGWYDDGRPRDGEFILLCGH